MRKFGKTVFPATDAHIRLAMIGMIPGNGHPYSWSAIINGYVEEELNKCPYPVIPKYMAQQGENSSGIDRATVTHIWTDDPEDALKVAAATRIHSILQKPEDAIGKVDAVIIATDDGDNHVARARPFIEAGLPVFIDKPLATNMEDLQYFVEKEAEGHFIMSSSGMRYAPEMISLKGKLADLGEIRWISSFGIKKWETYGIHALESIFPLLGPGFKEIRMDTYEHGVVASLRHETGAVVTLPVFKDGPGSFGAVQVCGTKGPAAIQIKDTFSAFKAQLETILNSIRARRPAIPFSETTELMRILIAGRISMSEMSRRVQLAETSLHTKRG
jgi:predicted dehydrogenase